MRSGRGGLPFPLPPLLAWALAVAVVVLHATAAHGQTAITPTPGAGALGTAVNQVGNSFDITGGTRAGGNLFHSFGLFSVGTGDIANFSNTTGAGVANILGRVTGGQVSARVAFRPRPGWDERSFRVPGRFLSDGSTPLTLSGRYATFYYWFYQ